MPTRWDEPTALACFGRDLTALAHAGRFMPLEGYKPWVSRVFEIVMCPYNVHYNPVLVGFSEAEA